MVIKELIWDEWNIAHIARHQVEPDEVEQVCATEHITWETYNNRILLAGRTRSGRLITIILGKEGEGTYYPVTARDSSKKERRYWRAQKGGEKAA